MKEFIEYLEGKRIDGEAFEKDDFVLFAKWESEFMQMHVKSFTSQKLYLINNIRRQYLLPEDRVKQPVKKVKVPTKVAVASKVKLGSHKEKSSIKPKINLGKPIIKKPIVKTSVSDEGNVDGVKKASLSLKPKIGLKKPLIQPKIQEKESTEDSGTVKKVVIKKSPILKPKIKKADD